MSEPLHAALRDTIRHLMRDEHPDPLDRVRLADRLRALLDELGGCGGRVVSAEPTGDKTVFVNPPPESKKT